MYMDECGVYMRIYNQFCCNIAHIPPNHSVMHNLAIKPHGFQKKMMLKLNTPHLH